MRLVQKYWLIKCRRRGFTLLELAIVMVIIGSIVGVLFAAGSTASHKVSINQATDELGQISQNMRNLYAGRTTSYAALGPLNATAADKDFTKFTPTYVQQNVFPPEMLSPGAAPGTVPCNGTVANNAFGGPAGTCGAAAVGTALIALAGSATTQVQYVIRYKGLSANDCADLLVRNSLPGRETGLAQIIVNNNNVPAGIAYNTTTPLPLTSIAATNACNSTTNIIDWYYNLNG